MADLGELAAKLTLDSSGYTTTLGNAKTASETFGTKVGGVFSGIATTVGIVAGAVVGVGTAIIALGKQGSTLLGLQQAFQSNFKTLDSGIKKIQDAAKGTVDDLNVMKEANYAASLGITNNVDKIAGVMTTARYQARALGMSTTDAFDNLVTAIGKGSTKLFTTMGIQIPDALKATMKGMDATQQKATLLNFVIQRGTVDMKEFGDSMTAGEKIAAMQVKFDDLKDTLEKDLAPLAGDIADIVGKLADTISDLFTQISTGQYKTVWLKTVVEIIKTISEALKTFWTTVLVPVGKYIGSTLYGYFSDLFTQISTGQYKTVWLKTVVETIKTIWEALKTFWTTVLVPVGKYIGSTLYGDFLIMWDIVKKLALATYDFGEKMYNAFLKSKYWDIAKWAAFGIVGEILINVVGDLLEVVDTGKSKVKWINDLIATITNLWTIIKDFWTNTLKPILDFLWADIQRQIIPAWENLKAVVKEFWEQIKPYWPYIKMFLETVAVLIAITILGAIYLIIGIIGILINVIAGIISIVGAVGKAIMGEVNSIIDSVQKVISWIQTAIDKYKEFTKSFLNIASESPIKAIGDWISGKAKASGGLASGLTLVGENGPELVNLPTGSKVTNNMQTKEAMNNTSNKNVNINNTFNVSDPSDISVAMRQLNWLYRRF